jgi:hypothetical protein
MAKKEGAGAVVRDQRQWVPLSISSLKSPLLVKGEKEISGTAGA